jgi:hypothetical protein
VLGIVEPIEQEGDGTFAVRRAEGARRRFGFVFGRLLLEDLAKFLGRFLGQLLGLPAHGISGLGVLRKGGIAQGA